MNAETICPEDTACNAHGLQCEEWVTVDVMPIPETVSQWYIQCETGDPKPIAWMAIQELRSVTCADDNGGYEQQLTPPFPRRVVLVAEEI